MLRSFFSLIFILSFLSKIGAQEIPSGSIKGKVIDKATKQPIPGAIVVIKGTQIAVTSDSLGLFVLNKISEGNYSIIISLIGYQEKTINDIQVARNKTN